MAAELHEFPHLRANLTNLIGAAIEGDLDRVKELLAKGSPANKSNDYGFTALHHAARRYVSLGMRCPAQAEVLPQWPSRDRA